MRRASPDRFGRILGLLVITLAALNIGCATDRQVIEQAQQMHGSLEPAIINDPQLANYLQTLGDRVIDAAGAADESGYGPKKHFDSQDRTWMFSNRMKFHLVNSKTLNAFTTGGEHMYIYNQLFQECQTEDELAAVMAHEYGHVYGRHVANGMDNRYKMLAIAALGGVAGAAVGGEDNRVSGAAAGAGVGLMAGQFVNMGFTRKDETEADKLGFYFYTHAGWDPNHFGDFFQHMIDKGYDKTPELLSDHPTLKSRVEDATRRTGELPPNASAWRKAPVANAQEFARLKSRAADLSKRLPDDKSLAGSQELLQALPRSCVAPVDPDDAVKARERIVEKSQSAETTPKKKAKPKPQT